MTPEPYYQDDFVTLYCGDNREIAPGLGSFDLLLTDPPYGIRAGGSGGWRSAAKEVTWDDAPPSDMFLQSIIGMADSAIVWGGNYFSLPPSRCWLVWDKNNGTNSLSDCELAWTNLSDSVRKFTWHHFNGERTKAVHPTQKPLPLMHWCISHTKAKTIFDPFSGSGTTLLAAKQKGLKAVGIEISEAYCKAAVDRLSQGVLWSGMTQIDVQK